jgi:hypothetical protein
MAQGQFEVELSLDAKNYLKYEPITAHVKISNLTGHTIGLFNHRDKPWLSFYVSRQSGEQVDELGVEYDLQQAQVAGGDTLTVHVNLTPVYNIRAPGIYRVMAVVNSASYNRQIKSNICQFDLASGRPIWQETVVLFPSGPVSEAAIPDTMAPQMLSTNDERRTYVLLAHREGRGEKLYARVEDGGKGVVYGLLQLGVLVGFGKPVARVDNEANLHVLHQTGSRAYSYSKISKQGKRLDYKIYSNIYSRPEFKTQGDGGITVVGGEQTYPNPALSSLPMEGSLPFPELPESDTPKAE